MAERTVKPLQYKELEGLSEKQISQHHDVLYAGYVKKTNEIRTALAGVDLAGANATYSTLRELKVEESFALNGVKLHESYFFNLGGKEPISGTIKEWIARDFGSYEKWEAEFRALSVAARGWVVLAFDLEEGRLYNFVADMHSQGGIWGSVPVLVHDVYEHAYFIDYATDRKSYINAFFKNIRWQECNEVIKRYKLDNFRK